MRLCVHNIINLSLAHLVLSLKYHRPHNTKWLNRYKRSLPSGKVLQITARVTAAKTGFCQLKSTVYSGLWSTAFSARPFPTPPRSFLRMPPLLLHSSQEDLRQIFALLLQTLAWLGFSFGSCQTTLFRATPRLGPCSNLTPELTLAGLQPSARRTSLAMLRHTSAYQLDQKAGSKSKLLSMMKLSFSNHVSLFNLRYIAAWRLGGVRMSVREAVISRKRAISAQGDQPGIFECQGEHRKKAEALREEPQ